MSTIPYTLKFNRMDEWARQQSLHVFITYATHICRVRRLRVKYCGQNNIMLIDNIIAYWQSPTDACDL